MSHRVQVLLDDDELARAGPAVLVPGPGHRPDARGDRAGLPGVILVDANIPMYVVGAPGAERDAAYRLLERAADRGEVLVTDAEVFSEIIHRYRSIARPDAIQPAFDVLLAAVSEVLPIDLPTVQRAKEVLAAHDGLSARDALHLAVMDEHRIGRIKSFDRGFDARPDLERIS